MYPISTYVSLSDEDIECSAIRAQGSGGQNVNKVSSAIHLRFDIRTSSLPDFYKERLLALKDKRLTKEGCIVIKAQKFRTQEQNKEDAIARLIELIKSATKIEKARRATKPTKGSQRRRMDSKNKRGQLKQNRKKPSF